MVIFREAMKRSKRTWARWGIMSLVWLVDHLPFSLVHGFVNLALAFVFLLTYQHRRAARESLRIAFGNEKSAAEIEKIIKDCFRVIRWGIIDLLYYSRYPAQVLQHIAVEGQSCLDEALKKGRGALLVTAHFGNFPVMMLALAQMGYKVNVVMRRARDEKIAAYILKIMNRVGVYTIYTKPPRVCVQESIRVLRNNEILFVLLDQHFGSEGNVVVDFFGQKASTATGPVILAQRTQSPVLMAFNVLLDNKQNRVIIEPELSLAEGKTEESIRLNVAKITREIERYIRAYPHEWGWMHRRWKNQKAGNPPASASSLSEAF